MSALMMSEEQQLLTRSEARALLESHHRTVLEVVRVCDDDAILFIGAFKRPWTAWFTRQSNGIDVQYEQGWPATFNSVSRVSAPTRLPTPTHDHEMDQA